MLYLRSQAAGMANVNTGTIRYYEKLGLISIQGKDGNGRKLYDDNTIKKLGFIKNAKTCGLTLGEIKTIFLYLDSESVDYDDLAELVGKRLEDVDERIEQLNGMKNILTRIKLDIDSLA